MQTQDVYAYMTIHMTHVLKQDYPITGCTQSIYKNNSHKRVWRAGIRLHYIRTPYLSEYKMSSVST